MLNLATKYTRPNSGLAFRPDTSCVLWLPGQDDAYSVTIRDRLGKGNHGTIYGALWKRNSQGLWYLDLDGDDYVTITDAPSFNITTALTVITWVKVTNVITGNRFSFPNIIQLET